MATYKISAECPTDTKTVVKARNFSFIIDEPPAGGGEDAGPTPVEYLIGAYAGCLNVVSHMVAKEMGLTLNSLHFDIEGDLDSKKFSGRPTTGRAGYYHIRINIRADINADQSTKLKWITQVKERCPVSDNVSNATPVTITLS